MDVETRDRRQLIREEQELQAALNLAKGNGRGQSLGDQLLLVLPLPTVEVHITEA
jgi:hypothetical protein